MTVYDDFLPNAEEVRAQALAAPFGDFEGHDGEVYQRVWVGPVPGLLEAIEAKVGSVQMLGMGYRLNYQGEMPNAAIHSDLGWGTHAAVVFLTDGDSGTAFWEHRVTGARRIDGGDYGLYEKVQNDWNDESKWTAVEKVPMAFNRGLIYESAIFHSRHPFEAFGTTPETGRLVAIAFFNVLEPHA